jgi:ribosomal protein S18 acetylase RimI-like enzyme
MIERLGPDYATAAAGLYGESDEVFYAQFMLSTGVFYGAFRKEEMVAISGTHAVTKRYDMATVGGVFTHPEHRGHSLAKATTSHVVAAVREMGINDVALNVRQDNHPAIRAYERLGFRITLEFTEGTLSARESPPAAP